MDHPQYSTLWQVLAAVPDPRKARGKQLEWTFILGVIATAILSHQRAISAIAQWTQHHAATLVATFQPARGRVPSEATLRRALRHVDIVQLEHQLTALTVSTLHDRSSPEHPPLQGYAVDGKYVRGAGTHGQPTLLVSLVQHHQGQVLAQTRVPPERHESVGVQHLLAGQKLTGKVLTLDAGLAHPALAAQIRAQGGHYLMVVKRNQARLYDELTWYFDTPPLPCDRPWCSAQTITKGHGRLELRRLTCTDDLDNYLQWPGVQQVVRRICERTLRKTGVLSEAVTYALTSLPAHEVTAADIAQLWRGHWTIENRVHYVRDVSMGEDAHQMHTGNAPQVLAAFRNAWLNILRMAGWTNIAAALRHYSWSIQEALALLGVSPSRL
jgi:predicted transposase YbfD/YdcC